MTWRSFSSRARCLFLSAAACVTLFQSAPAATVDFEDLGLASNSYYNGDNGQLVVGEEHDGSFVSRSVRFQNRITDYGPFTAWSGWSASNMTDVTTADYATGQYSAYVPPSGGGDGSAGYGVISKFDDPDKLDLESGRVSWPENYRLASARVANVALAALVMRDGDPFGFAKQFGGPSGKDPDWFKATFLGVDAQGDVIGGVPFYLADYRAADSAGDYIVSQWTTVDLSSLSAARALAFSLSSSDTGEFGMNTPAYFALDNLSFAIVPEPSGLVLVALAAAIGCLRLRRGRQA